MKDNRYKWLKKLAWIVVDTASIPNWYAWKCLWQNNWNKSRTCWYCNPWYTWDKKNAKCWADKIEWVSCWTAPSNPSKDAYNLWISVYTQYLNTSTEDFYYEPNLSWEYGPSLETCKYKCAKWYSWNKNIECVRRIQNVIILMHDKQNMERHLNIL